MLRQTVSSSNIEQVGYRRGSLFIRFNSGATYSYDQVPFEIFQHLIDAESAGKTFHKEVRGKYKYHKLETDPFTKGH
jgi:hypothetical protein